MLTRNGICYNLELSPYRVKVGNIIYHFSSENHCDKFLCEQTEFREKIRFSLENRFKFPFGVDELADILLYKKIEGRGFYIDIGGEIATCLESLKFHGTIIK